MFSCRMGFKSKLQGGIDLRKENEAEGHILRYALMLEPCILAEQIHWSLLAIELAISKSIKTGSLCHEPALLLCTTIHFHKPWERKGALRGDFPFELTFFRYGKVNQ